MTTTTNALNVINPMPKRVQWTPCTPSFAHHISGLECVGQTMTKKGLKTTWYTRNKHTGKRIPISFRIWCEDSNSYIEAGYNADYWNQSISLQERFEYLNEVANMTPETHYEN
jgi:hypothetical protein